MPEIRFTCLYCDNKWVLISYYSTKNVSSRCQRCKESKMIKSEIVNDKAKTGNVFGYEEDEPEEEDDQYRD